MTAEGGFNPTWQRHVAAYALAPGYLPAGRLLDLGCGIGHSYHLLAPRETVGVDISAEALPARTAKRSSPTCATLPFGDWRVRLGALGPIARARARSRAGDRRGGPGAEGRRRRDVRDAEPADAGPARRDHRPVPLPRVRLHRARRPLRLSASARSASLGLFGSPALHGALRRGARASSIACSPPTRCACAASCRCAPSRGCTTRCSAAPAAGPDPRGGGDRAGRFRVPRERSARPPSTSCAVCALPQVVTRAQLTAPRRGPPPASGAERRSTPTRATAADSPSAPPAGPRRPTRRRTRPSSPPPTATGTGRRRRAALLVRGRRDPRPHPRAARSRIDAIAPPGPVLDVGAGDGTLVDALRARGREAIGLERNPLRPDFREETARGARGRREWAAVIFWHSLEHLPEPGEAITAGRAAAEARGRGRRRGPEHRQPPGRAVRQPLAAPRPAAPPRPPLGGDAGRGAGAQRAARRARVRRRAAARS